MPRRSLRQLYRDEFHDYTSKKFIQDLLAGFTVAAVALPLALAFGVASGATAASGMVTAVVAGVVIGALAGAPYQISGPTGAMSAVLIVLSAKYGIEGVWVAGLFSGLFLVLIGMFKLGRFIAFIPSPVIAGFTSGIALIIVVGQIDNLLGIKTPKADSAALKLIHILQGGWSPSWSATLIGVAVMLTMLLWPMRWGAKLPASLCAIIGATILAHLLKLPVATVGEIPRSIVLDQRLHLAQIPWSELPNLVVPILSITALGAIESLLCGAVGSNMTGIRLQANQELVAQGVGNMLLPFFGGVPATAAIARSSVGIKSGGHTRLVGISHALFLLASVLMLAPLMSEIPLAALAGVLVVTAWRMNEWEDIHYMFRHNFKSAWSAFLITMIATVSLDLTEAVLIGSFLSGAVFLNQISQLQIEIKEIEEQKLLERGIVAPRKCAHTRVAFITGPLFFAAVGHFNEAFAKLENCHALILALRGVPLIDTTGLLALEALHERICRQGGVVMLAGVNSGVMQILERGGMLDLIGRENILWSSDQAIVAAGERPCRHCAQGSSFS